MTRGLFVTGFTISEVLAIQQKAKEFLLEGKTLMNWSDSGTSAGKQFTMAVDEVLMECAHALRLLDPDTYGTTPGQASVSFVPGHLAK